jgi:hypothetical protein
MLIIGAVVVLGVVSLFVYQHNRTQDTGAAANNSQVQTPNDATSKADNNDAQAQSTNAVVQLPELGIQITVPASIKDLTYVTKQVTLPNNNTATYALLSTTSLTNIDQNCSPASGALGSIGTASGQYPADDPYPVLDYGALLKQFPTFYVTYDGPQGGCSQNTTALSASAVDKGALQASLSSIQPISQ